VKAYRTSAKLKLGLIVAAVAIAVSSLAWTNRLADRLMEQDAEAVRLWARAIEYQAGARAFNPYLEQLQTLDSLVAAGRLAPDTSGLRAALAWARSMPPSEELDFVFNEVIAPRRFSVPAIITDSQMTAVITHQNVRVDSTAGEPAVSAELLERAREMDLESPPIRFEYLAGEVQLVHYGESSLARMIRLFPFVQLLFVALFVLVGYMGFSYVRRSEQSLLWVGMAKEAAHQLGTPLSSMIGWIELLRLRHEGEAAIEGVADELERDVSRLRRVADRFEKIGTAPVLAPAPVGPALEHVADYMRRRVPQQGRRVELTVASEPDLHAWINGELFEWVIENLLKNALDAIEGDGEIAVRAARDDDEVIVEVADTGKGIDRSVQRMIFRPGFSTKRRGWGLGLSLARRIVEEYHGGRLDLLDSRPGVGTTFGITLRAAEAPPGDGAATTPAEVAGAGGQP
jgi:signal transduction histidine kinase